MRTAFARIRKIGALSAADWMLLPGALLAVLSARARLLLLPFGRVRDWAAVPARKNPHIHDPALLVARVARAVKAASVCVPGGRNCLVRAIAVQRMLSRLGLTSEVRIGVSKTPAGQLAAHAWVECMEVVVIGGAFESARYAQLFHGSEYDARP